MTPRRLADHWLDLGAKVLPLNADKEPVGHLVPRGFHDASQHHAWWFNHEDTELVGFVPGSMGLIVLDVDIKFGKRGDRALAALEMEHGGTIPKDVTVTTPSGGWHIYLRKPDSNEHIGNSRICADVDVRSDGGYVVAPGSPGYEGTNIKIEDIPFAPEWLMQLLREAAETPLDSPYSAPEARREEQWHEKVTEACSRFEGATDRHNSMLEVVGALASYELGQYAGATAALEAFEEVYIRAIEDRSNPADARREYRRALEGARRRVRSNESLILKAQEERAKDAEFIELIKANGGTEEDAERIAERADELERLPFHSIRELCEQDFTLNWLVRNVLVRPTYGQIAGESKTLKTFLSQYLGIAVATGAKFLGRFPVDHTGPVVYFVGEGGMKGWSQRMPRIAASVGVSPERLAAAPIHASFTPAPFLSPIFKNTVKWVLEHYNPVLTIVDPLYAYHGGEVEAQNMLAMGALLTDVAEPFVEHGSTLLINNHFNKQSGKTNLNRITMSGSAEWVDSWILNTRREDPDLNNGEYYITTEFGSRQWGGSRWDITLNIGVMDPMGGEPQTPVTLDVRESWDE